MVKILKEITEDTQENIVSNTPDTNAEKIETSPVENETPISDSEKDTSQTISESNAEPKTIQDWIDLRNQRTKEMKDFIKSRKAVMKWDEAREYRKKVIYLRSRVGDCDRKICELKRKEKLLESQKGVSKMGLKRAIFLGLLKSGFSITNIVKIGELKKEELEELLNNEFLQDCEKVQPGFNELWTGWKNKFLKK